MPTVNWSNPTNSSDYLDVLGLLRDRDDNLAAMDFSADSNIPATAIQWDNTNEWFERYNGSTFDKILPEANASQLLAVDLDDTGLTRGSLYQYDGTDFTQSVTRGTIRGTCGGSSNAYTLTTGLGLTALTSGMTFVFIANHTNTGAATIAVDSVSALDIKKHGGLVDPVSTDLLVNCTYIIQYDGTDFNLLNPRHIPILTRVVASNTTSNTASETSESFTLPAGILGGTAGVKYSMVGAIFNNTGSSKIFTFKAAFGGSVIHTLAYTVNSSASNFGAFRYEVVTWNKTSATQTSYVTLEINDSGSTDASAGNAVFSRSYHAVDSATIDTTSSVALNQSLTMSAASASLSWTRYLYSVELF